MRKRLFFFLLIVFFFGLSDLYATWQQPDILLFEGKEYPIYSEPLEQYFKKYPDRKPEICERNSSLWRGYIAVIEVVENQLFLKEIKLPSDSAHWRTEACEEEWVLTKIVPDGKPLKINWISGLLTSMYGKNDGDSYSLDFLNTFERYSIFEIDSGYLRRVKHFNNKQFQDFRVRQFRAFKKTGEYKELVKKMTADGRLRKADADANILLWLTSYTNKFLFD